MNKKQQTELKIDDLRIDPFINRILEGNSEEVIEQAEILMKYDGYISKEQDMANKLKKIDIRENPIA